MISEHELCRMGIEIILSLEVWFFIFADIVINQGQRYYERDYTLVIVLNNIKEFSFTIKSHIWSDEG